MTGSRKRASPNGGPQDPRDAILRAKYLDYCSSRVAETLLVLSPDEIFLLAQDAARELGGDVQEPLSYDEMVQLATGRISRKLNLPSFSAWAESYRADPAPFDREMLGLWESDASDED